ncbi:MAG: hypothetical protein ABIZ81_18610 [Opitutaceae bacterium]
MSSQPKRGRVLPVVAAVFLGSIVIFIWKNGVGSLHRSPAWAMAAIKLKLSLEPDASVGAYERTATGPFALATVIREFREEWPKESIALIHWAALEVGTALLHRGDIEVGELVGGKFVPSKFPPWHTNEKMLSEIQHSPDLFGNDRVYVFRRR